MATATRTVTYNGQETALTGFLAWDDAAPRPVPGLLLVHGGAGLDDHAKGQAQRYAAHGYAVLACDMFGDGVAGNRERVMACLTGLRDDPPRLSRRMEAGLAALASSPEAEGRFAAVGFCFGGLAVLTLARSGADVMGVVSIHGSLATVRPAEPGAVKAKVLACHGAPGSARAARGRHRVRGGDGPRPGRLAAHHVRRRHAWLHPRARHAGRHPRGRL